jgi:hypothetical protein
MVAIRELPATGKVNAEVIGRQRMLVLIREQLRREVPRPVVDGTSKMLFAFGAVNKGFDLEQSLLDLMSAELAGFYQPEQKTLYLLDDLVGPERDATLSHELVHALQDQHYDLHTLIAYRDDASDEQSAVHALAEGDATSAMLDQILAPRGLRGIDVEDELVSLQARGMMELNPDLASVPGIIRRSVISSYTDGLPFVHWARRRGGWAEVDKAWRDPPRTSEQLLHPDKYLAREPPIVLPLPLAPEAGPRTLIYRDIQGEQSLRLLLEEWVLPKTAAEAARGWGGDRLAVFSEGDRTAVAWHLRYDDPQSAARSMVTIARGVLRKDENPPTGNGARETPSAQEAERAIRRGTVCQARAQRGAFAAVRKGADIAIVAGPFTPVAAAAAATSSCAAAVRWATAVASQRDLTRPALR